MTCLFQNYVHRSGRTARANKEGLSVVLVGQQDTKNYKKIMHTLNKSKYWSNVRPLDESA